MLFCAIIHTRARAASLETDPDRSIRTTQNEQTNKQTQGLRMYGREWKRVAADIKTRTSAQIRSHAQKYFAKLAKSRPLLLQQVRRR